MPTVVQGVSKPQVVIKIIAKELRDILLSLPEDERRFIISNPPNGYTKINNLYLHEEDEELIPK